MSKFIEVKEKYDFFDVFRGLERLINLEAVKFIEPIVQENKCYVRFKDGSEMCLNHSYAEIKEKILEATGQGVA